MSIEKVVLQAKKLIFYSQKDETIFFNWLRKIRCVEHYEGRGDTLYITVDKDSVDERTLRELHAIFRRYSFVDMNQLSIFKEQAIPKRKIK